MDSPDPRDRNLVRWAAVATIASFLLAVVFAAVKYPGEAHVTAIIAALVWVAWVTAYVLRTRALLSALERQHKFWINATHEQVLPSDSYTDELIALQRSMIKVLKYQGRSPSASILEDPETTTRAKTQFSTSQGPCVEWRREHEIKESSLTTSSAESHASPWSGLDYFTLRQYFYSRELSENDKASILLAMSRKQAADFVTLLRSLYERKRYLSYQLRVALMGLADRDDLPLVIRKLAQDFRD